jgi:zinc D-Ala-D-Ala carboxypeptidase
MPGFSPESSNRALGSLDLLCGPGPSFLVRPASRPNYQLRRLVALTTLFLIGYSVWRLIGVVTPGGPEPVERAGSSSPSATPTISPSPSTTPAVVAAPPDCTRGSERAEDRRPADWGLTLLDTQFTLPKSYVPPTLVPVSRAGFPNAAGLFVRSLMIEDLTALRQAAKDAGNPIDIVAAYRSFADQASLFQRRKDDLGLAEAERKTARAGHSEHQLGTAVDFKTLGEPDVDARWDSTPAGSWMQAHAWRYGFVQSYPKGESEVTCYGYEPWHYRYFGRDVATAIHESGMTVREYLWNLIHGVA